MIKNVLAFIGMCTVGNYLYKLNNWVVEKRVNEIISKRNPQ